MQKLIFGIGVAALLAFTAQPADAFGGHGCRGGWFSSNGSCGNVYSGYAGDCGCTGLAYCGGQRSFRLRDRDRCGVATDCGCWATCDSCDSGVADVGSGQPTEAPPAPQVHETHRPVMSDEHATSNDHADHDAAHAQAAPASAPGHHQDLTHPQNGQTSQQATGTHHEQPSPSQNGTATDHQQGSQQTAPQDAQATQHAKQGTATGQQASQQTTPQGTQASQDASQGTPPAVDAHSQPSHQGTPTGDAHSQPSHQGTPPEDHGGQPQQTEPSPTMSPPSTN